MQGYTSTISMEAFVTRLNRKSMLGLLKDMSNAQLKSQTDLGQGVQDQINSLTKTLQDYQDQNKVLSENEIKMIEAALADILRSLEAKGLFSLVIKSNGKSYSIRDVVETVANLPVIQKERAIVDESDDNILAMEFTLSDNSVCVFQAVISEQDNMVIATYSGNINGYDASYVDVASVRVDQVNGQSIPTYAPLYKTNIVFDIFTGLKETTSFTADEIAPDMNGDGVIGGTPLPAVTPSEPVVTPVEPVIVPTAAPTVTPTVAPTPAPVDTSGDGAVL